jgi:hypothetical protein
MGVLSLFRFAPLYRYVRVIILVSSQRGSRDELSWTGLLNSYLVAVLFWKRAHCGNVIVDVVEADILAVVEATTLAAS